jgi:hypothetical protein
MAHRFLHPRFTLPIGATIAFVTLVCATDTAEPPRHAENALADVSADSSDMLARERSFSTSADTRDAPALPDNLDDTEREKEPYAKALRARIEALSNTAFAVDADQASSDDFDAWRDLQTRRQRLEVELASLGVVTADEWPLLRENLDAELGVVRRDMRTAARLPVPGLR